MDLKPKNKIATVFLILVVATVAFIFAQSAIPPEQSGAQSDKVGGAIVDAAGGVINTDTEKGAEIFDSISSFITQYIRKIAHFTEFGVLGVFVCMYLFVNRGERKLRLAMPFKVTFCLFSICFCIVVAFADETIQEFSNRVPAVPDMWVDLAGFATLYAIAFVILIFVGEKRCGNKNV
jgi:hypothetical protein